MVIKTNDMTWEEQVASSVILIASNDLEWSEYIKFGAPELKASSVNELILKRSKWLICFEHKDITSFVVQAILVEVDKILKRTTC